jgi:hypothetical protein
MVTDLEPEEDVHTFISKLRSLTAPRTVDPELLATASKWREAIAAGCQGAWDADGLISETSSFISKKLFPAVVEGGNFASKMRFLHSLVNLPLEAVVEKCAKTRRFDPTFVRACDIACAFERAQNALVRSGSAINTSLADLPSNDDNVRTVFQSIAREIGPPPPMAATVMSWLRFSAAVLLMIVIIVYSGASESGLDF